MGDRIRCGEQNQTRGGGKGMKKIVKCLLTVALAATVCVPLAACGNTESPIDGNNNMFWAENEFENDTNRRPDRAPVQRTLTLEGGATFADGSTSKVLESGQSLILGEDILFDVPEGKRVAGWQEVDEDPDLFGQFHEGSKFETIRKDATIYPVLDVPEETYATTNQGGDKKPMYGKVSNFAWERRDAQTTEGGFVCKDTLLKTEVGGELGSVFHALGGSKEEAVADAKIASGWYTLFLSGYKVVSSQNMTLNFIVENFGTEAVDLKLYQTNNSSSPITSQVSAPVHLEPGEVETTAINIGGWTNGNILTTLQLVNSVKELKVGLCAYVKDVADAESYTLAVEGGTIAAEGGDVTSVEIAEGAAVPELKYTPSEEEVWLGWVNKEDEKETYPSTGFSMPAKDITLKPLTATKEPRKVTLGENLKFDDETTEKLFDYGAEIDLSKIVYNGEVKKGHRIIFKIETATTVKQLNSGEKYTMTHEEATITFVGTEVVYSSTNGKLAMYPKPNTVTKVRDDKSQIKALSAEWGTVGDEEGSIFTLAASDDTTIKNGNVFMMQQNDSPVQGVYTDTVTIVNLGESAISVKVAISRSSGDFDQNGLSDTITIQPGETKTVSYTVNFDKSNDSEMVSVQYVGETEIDEMTIGMFIYRAPQA